jgi:chromosome partitioning protein
MHRGEVITVAHTKGGVGKTSLVFNLGYALADAGVRTLVVDLDPQMGQSAYLPEGAVVGRDVSWVLAGRCSALEAAVEVSDRLDLLPGVDELAVSTAWTSLSSLPGQERLAGALAVMCNVWDVVLLDTPGHQSPSLGAVLRASDGVIVPMPPEAGPVAELPTILNAVAAARGAAQRPEVVGVVRSRVWGNSVYRRVAEEQIRVIAEEFGVPVFRHKVPEDAKFGEAHLVGQAVGAYQPHSRSAVAYRYLAYELIRRRGWPFVTPEVAV